MKQTIYLVKIKKGVRPYGGRSFFATRTGGPASDYQVDVSRRPTAYNYTPPDYSHWTQTFGRYGADWRAYRHHEIIVRRVVEEGGSS